VQFLVTSLANKLSIAASRRIRRDLGIGLMEWRVIALLAVEGESSPGRVSQVAGVDKSVVSRAVTALERRRLIRVLADDQQPGRQTRLQLTPAGMTLHDRGIAGVLTSEAALQHGLSDADSEALIGLLKRLISNLPRLDEA
jgi:DNA-binding MarR family transcriptional regulator